MKKLKRIAWLYLLAILVAPMASYATTAAGNGSGSSAGGGGTGTAGCTYSSPQPVMSPGQTAAQACDANNNLKVVVSGVTSTAAPAAVNKSVAVNTSSTVVLTANTNRIIYEVCNPPWPNQMDVYVDPFNEAATVGALNFKILPGDCRTPDALPATSAQITAIAAPEPGSTAVPVTVTVLEQ